MKRSAAEHTISGGIIFSKERNYYAAYNVQLLLTPLEAAKGQDSKVFPVFHQYYNLRGINRAFPCQNYILTL